MLCFGFGMHTGQQTHIYIRPSCIEMYSVNLTFTLLCIGYRINMYTD